MRAKIVQSIYNVTDIGMVATEGAIVGYMRCSESESVSVSKLLKKMVDDDYLGEQNGEYWVTTDGHNLYGEAIENPYEAQPGYGDWLDMVQTGMDGNGRRADVENPVVPSPQPPPARDAENIIIRSITRGHKLRKNRKKYRPRVG